MATESITFWSDLQNLNIVRILYLSNTSWDKTMMADIDLHNKSVNFFMGEVFENRRLISEFQLNTMEPSLISFRELSLSGCDLTIINDANCIIQKVIDESNENADEHIKLKTLVDARLAQ